MIKSVNLKCNTFQAYTKLKTQIKEDYVQFSSKSV